MSDLHVFTDDVEWYVAASLDDALAAQREQGGFGESDQDPEDWERCPGERLLSIHMDEKGEAGDDSDPLVTKTCAEWAAEKGRGFLCSTEF